MAYKPGDFFLGVIDFLAVLVPGLVLLWLQGEWMYALYPLGNPIDNPGWWFPVLVAAYVLGHFLFFIGERFLNRFHNERRKMPEIPKSYYKRLTEREGDRFPKQMDALNLKQRDELFHSSFSHVRLSGGDALTEVERSAASYKLFRSLVVVFALDAILSTIPTEWTVESFFSAERIRVIVSGVLAYAAYLRFAFLRNWTEGLAFEFAALIASDTKDVEGS